MSSDNDKLNDENNNNNFIINNKHSIYKQKSTIIEELEKEKEVVGFYLSAHPLDTYKQQLKWFNYSSFAHLLTLQQNPPNVERCREGDSRNREETWSEDYHHQRLRARTSNRRGGRG